MLTYFNAAESAVNVDYLRMCRQVAPSSNSAIDAFYAVRDIAVVRAYQEPFLSDPPLRGLLLLMLFSSAETYFRRVIAEVLAMCPIAAESAAQQQIPLGAIAAFGSNALGVTIADTRGLTSTGEIANRTKTLLGINIDKGSSLGVAIDQFEKVCNLRHTIAHSSGELLFNNRRELKLALAGRQAVEIDGTSLQEVVQVISNVVRAYNNKVANDVLVRWFVQGHFVGRWQTDRRPMERFFKLFSSTVDRLPAGNALSVYRDARKKMKKSGAGSLN